MLVALLSLKGSPGVTTAALALAGFWPGDRPTRVIEADPAGGDVRCWFQIPGDAGLAGLATAARHAHGPGLLLEHGSELPGGLRVVSAPEGPEQARAAVDLLVRDGADLLEALRRDAAVTVADLGRLDESSPAAGILAHADATVLLTRPSLAEISRAAARIEAVKAASRKNARVGLVLLGRGYPPAEIEEALRTPVLGTLPQDEACTAVLSGRAGARRGLRYTALARAARALGTALEQASPSTNRLEDVSQLAEARA